MWISNMESVGKSMYAEYRQENLIARSDGKTPKSFSRGYKAPRQSRPEFPDISPIKSKLPSIDPKAKMLQDAMKAYMDHFKTIENLSPDELELSTYDFKEGAIDSISEKFLIKED